MKYSALYLAPILAATVSAQSAPEFAVVIAENLPVTYEASNTTVSPPGVLLPRDDVLTAPAVTLPESADPNTTYIVFLIDQDVPRNGSSVTLLHWFAPSLQRTPTNTTLATIMPNNNMPTIEGAPYIPPTPPGGSGPHRYTFLLYPQPDNFTLPDAYTSISPPADTSVRVGFNITAFAEAANLSDPIAANYLRVLNGTAAETSSASALVGTSGVAPTASPTITASITDSAAASSASEAAATGSTTTAGSGEASATESAGANASAGMGESGAASVQSSQRGREVVMGMALAVVVGAGMVLA